MPCGRQRAQRLQPSSRLGSLRSLRQPVSLALLHPGHDLAGQQVHSEHTKHGDSFEDHSGVSSAPANARRKPTKALPSTARHNHAASWLVFSNFGINGGGISIPRDGPNRVSKSWRLPGHTYTVLTGPGSDSIVSVIGFRNVSKCFCTAPISAGAFMRPPDSGSGYQAAPGSQAQSELC